MGSPPQINRFGLSRRIPSPTRRAIRQECGFGCIFCGEAFCDYEHFDPDFTDSTVHTVSGIALACPNCHRKITSRIISKQDVREARLSPKCLESGKATTFQAAPRGNQEFGVRLGGCLFLYPRTVLRIFGEELIALKSPEDTAGPVRVTAKFYGLKGEPCFEIEENIYSVLTKSWDVETKGKSWTIRSELYRVDFRLFLEDRQIVRVDRLRMQYRGVAIDADSDGIKIGYRGHRRIRYRGKIVNAECAIDINEESQ